MIVRQMIKMPVTPPIHGARKQAAFTLAEVVTSLSILSIICLALGSVLVLGGKAMTMSASGAGAQTSVAASASSRMASDLQVALAITEATPTAVTLSVPDRTGDNLPDTIRYSWGGTAGDPLRMQLNGAPAVVLAENIHKLDLGYLYRTVGRESSSSEDGGGGSAEPAPPVESAEQVLVSYVLGANSYGLTKNAWPSQYFNPTLPVNAISWKITRARVQLRRNGTNTGILGIEIRKTGSAYKPTGDLLASATVDVASIPTSNTWVEIPFTNLNDLAPGEGLALVITNTATKTIAYAMQNSSGAASGTAWSVSTDTGATWAGGSTTKSINFRIYGTVTTPAP